MENHVESVEKLHIIYTLMHTAFRRRGNAADDDVENFELAKPFTRKALRLVIKRRITMYACPFWFIFGDVWHILRSTGEREDIHETICP